MAKALPLPVFCKCCLCSLWSNPQQLGYGRNVILTAGVLPAAPCLGSTMRLHTKESWCFWWGNGEGAWSAWGGKRASEQLHKLQNPTCRKQLAERRPPLADAPALSLPPATGQHCRFPLPWEVLCLDGETLCTIGEKAKNEDTILQV